jgi:hypothetical protein
MRQDIEMDFVREFSHSGSQIGTCASSEEKRERIRVAILKEGKQSKPFRGTSLTYAEVYRQAYNKPIEMRRHVRPVSAPALALAGDEEDDEEGGAENDLEADDDE